MDVGHYFFMLSFMKFVLGEQEGFIVGGAFVKHIKQFPHVAFLELLSSEGTFVCGSSILNQVILITAAHCLDNVNQATAYVGNINRDEGRPCEVENFEQHHQWDTDNLINDIGLCKLRKPLKFGLGVKRVLLLRNPPRTKTADLAGWGAVEEIDYTDTTVLKRTAQRLWNHKQCKRLLDDIPKGTICGGPTHATKNYASRGDSGSGLVVKRNIMVGLVSYKDVDVSRSLVVYTDVAHYYDWILKTSKRLWCG